MIRINSIRFLRRILRIPKSREYQERWIDYTGQPIGPSAVMSAYHTDPILGTATTFVGAAVPVGVKWSCGHLKHVTKGTQDMISCWPNYFIIGMTVWDKRYVCDICIWSAIISVISCLWRKDLFMIRSEGPSSAADLMLNFLICTQWKGSILSARR